MAKRTQNADKSIGALLRQFRLSAGLSQTELGEVAGISFQQIQKYEKGANRIPSGRLQQFASALSVPVTKFFDQRGQHIDQSDATEVYSFAASPEGSRLIRAFRRINDSEIKRSIVRLAEALVE